MEYKKETEEFNKRWNIQNNENYQEEYIKFIARILNIYITIDEIVSEKGIHDFCQIHGIIKRNQNILSYIRESIKEERKLYYILQSVFWLPFKPNEDLSAYLRADDTYVTTKDRLYDKLSEAINLSNISLAITKIGDGVILYPRGEKEFDTKLVNEVLSLLKGNSQTHFGEALKFYQQGTKQSAIKSAEGLRRSLEEFLRFKLKNYKGLDKNIEELGKILKGIYRDSTIRNIIFQTFDYINKYFNENSKHKDGNIDETENEYLIYQVGVLMRYINRAIK